MELDRTLLNPNPEQCVLEQMYIGKRLDELPTPAAIVDRNVLERNCRQMLKACEALRVSFRPHVKTHKTTEITALQVGESTLQVNIVVSTLSEAEHLVGYLQTCNEQGKTVNVLYGLPLPPSQIQRLAFLGKRLGASSISVLIDHADQLDALWRFRDLAGFGVGIFVKIDTGYHRAGLPLHSADTAHLLKSILEHKEYGISHVLHGFYSHAGHSYGGGSSKAAMELLVQEIEGLSYAADAAVSIAKEVGNEGSLHTKFVLSVGATPTATSIENFLHENPSSEIQNQIVKLRNAITSASASHSVELHAGVYPVLDLQQLATKASPSSLSHGVPLDLTYSDIALTILAEVVSLYLHREPSEALIAAGSVALGREPCKSYTGWGVVSSWDGTSNAIGASGWMVGRISQEHGILQRVFSVSGGGELRIGQKVRIWPNHACIAGAGFGYYFIVDSSLPEGRRDEIIGVWIRCRGW